MGRTGIHPSRALEYVDSLGDNVIVEGVYTHLSSADSDDDYTLKQLESFKIAVKQISDKIELKYIHAQASNAILNYPECEFNLARPGLIMYGFPSDEETCKKIKLEPISKLKSKITFLKTVKEGTSIGYNRSYITTRETKVATIPIGYADGVTKEFGQVYIKNEYYPIVSDCMDMILVFSNKNIEWNEKVEIIGSHQTIKKVSLNTHKNAYHIYNDISNRVVRVHKNKKGVEEIYY